MRICHARKRHPIVATSLVAVATAVLAAGCGESQGCPLVGCYSEVVAYTILETPLAEAVHLNVRACRNGVCGESPVDSDVGSDYFILDGIYVVALDLVEGTAYANGYVIEVGDRWVLTIDYGWTGVAEDGDVVEITVTDEDAGRSAGIRKVLEYSEYRRGCGDCKTTIFGFPPP